MSYRFQRTLRSLSGHESRIQGTLAILAASGLVGLLGWTICARVPLLKVSTMGRIEPHSAVHRIEPPEAGRVVRSWLELDRDVHEGDLLVEFDSREERLQLAQSETTSASLTHDLDVLKDEAANVQRELDATGLVDEASLREATAKDQELVPRRALAQQREELAEKSPTGALSELEKLERRTEADELEHTSETQRLGIIRLQREQVARREALTAQLLQLRQEWHEYDVVDVSRFAPAEERIVRARTAAILERLQRLPRTREGYGLIHADLHPHNFCFDEGRLTVFDFDDCEYAWFVKDIAVVLFYVARGEPPERRDEAAAAFLAPFLAGYRSVRPFERAWLAAIPDLLALQRSMNYALFHQYRDPARLDDASRDAWRRFRRDIEGDVPVLRLDFAAF